MAVKTRKIDTLKSKFLDLVRAMTTLPFRVVPIYAVNVADTSGFFETEYFELKSFAAMRLRQKPNFM